MRIGIDISQIVYKTGVSNFVEQIVSQMITEDSTNDYVLFGSSLRQQKKLINFTSQFKNKKNVEIKLFSFPPSLLDLFWNRLHIFPIELFIGKIDVFISSDWTQPPSKSKKATILYDLVVYKYPDETAKKIVEVQKRRLSWVQKECDKIFCISGSTKKDVLNILHIASPKIEILYPGIN